MGIRREAKFSGDGRGWPGRGGTGANWWGLEPELKGQIRCSQAILLH